MKRNATENDVLVGLGDLEKLADRYEEAAVMLRKLAKSLRSVTSGFGGVEAPRKASGGRKAALHANAGPSKRKGMSPIVRKRLSEAMKKRWKERKAAQALPLRRAADKVNGQTASPNAA